MTFGEKRRQLRLFKRTASELRRLVNSVRLGEVEYLAFGLDRERFEALEFGMSAMKVWIPELDDEQEIIPGKGRLVRSNFLYRRSGDDREHLLFKSVPVYLEAT